MIDDLNKYSNLIVAALTAIVALITAVYVALTWGLLQEAKKTREQENIPNVIVSIMPFAPVYAQIYMQNVGRSPAFDLCLKWTLEPLKDSQPSTWKHPLLSPGAVERFFLPKDSLLAQGNLPSLDMLAEKYESLNITVSWKDSGERIYSNQHSYNLKVTRDGWFAIGWIAHAKEAPYYLEKLVDEVGKIRKYFSNLESKESLKEFLEQQKSLDEKGLGEQQDETQSSTEG